MTAQDDGMAEARQAMVSAIANEAAETEPWIGKAALDPRVMAALARVPRHRFVPVAERLRAYDNRPLPIGEGQTISQPYIVALMSDLAAVGPGDKVLEVGTGCGYQSAVLAELAGRVYSIETLPALASRAAALLAELGYHRIEVRQGDGSRGWPEAAPFDVILVTAAAERRVPEALIEQLAPGGRLVIPVGAQRRPLLGAFGLGPDVEQHLLLLTKDAEGTVTRREVLPVAFVPLVEGERRGDADPDQAKA